MTTVEIEPHEIEAMRQLVLNLRAITGTIIRDDDHRQRLINWTGMLEDVVARIETSPPPKPRR